MQKFEELYIGYKVTLEKLVTGQSTADSLDYYELKNVVFPVYEAITDKEKWLNQELLSLVDDTKIEFPCSKNFEIIYKNSFVRFELIDSFLSERKLSYDINDILNRMLDHFILKRESYKILRIIAELLWHSVKSDISLQIIDKLLCSYYSDSNFEDRTILFNLGIYLNENFLKDNRTFLNDKYPDFISY